MDELAFSVMADHEIIPRNEWSARLPKAPLTPMTNPDGWVVHYVGGPCPQDPTLQQSKALVYNLQGDAMADAKEGYIDIEYSFLIDLNGRIFEGRGFANKSGANGSSNYNGHAWAVCVLMGPGDGKATDRNHLTQEAKDALLWLTQEGARRNAAVSYVKGHRDVFPTHCPGDELYAFVPQLQAHLHDPEPHVDWHAVIELASWQQRVAARPLVQDEDPKHPKRPLDTHTMRALLKMQGYPIEIDEVYGPKCVEFIHDFKKKRHGANTDGTYCGGWCAAQLLKKA